MDTGGDSTHSGNGHADPQHRSAPSNQAAPSKEGAPVESSKPVEASAGVPVEPLIVVDDARDPVTGKIKKGHSLNPKGRPLGVPNRNTELFKLFTQKELGKVKALAFAQARKGDNALLEFLLDRILLKQTPEAAGIVIHNNPTASASAVAHQTFTNEFAEEIQDPAVRASFLDLVDQRATRLQKIFDAERKGN